MSVRGLFMPDSEFDAIVDCLDIIYIYIYLVPWCGCIYILCHGVVALAPGGERSLNSELKILNISLFHCKQCPHLLRLSRIVYVRPYTSRPIRFSAFPFSLFFFSAVHCSSS